MSVELDFLRDDLEHVEREIGRSERAPLEYRVTDEALWRRKLVRLRAERDRLIGRILEEERKFAQAEERDAA